VPAYDTPRLHLHRPVLGVRSRSIMHYFFIPYGYRSSMHLLSADFTSYTLTAFPQAQSIILISNIEHSAFEYRPHGTQFIVVVVFGTGTTVPVGIPAQRGSGSVEKGSANAVGVLRLESNFKKVCRTWWCSRGKLGKRSYSVVCCGTKLVGLWSELIKDVACLEICGAPRTRY
jgi:hypothetical protein